MKNWVLVEYLGDPLAAEYETVLDAQTREEALAIAKIKWKKMGNHDQGLRSDFFVTLVDLDEDGIADLDSEIDCISMAEITHEEEHPRFIEDEE